MRVVSLAARIGLVLFTVGLCAAAATYAIIGTVAASLFYLTAALITAVATVRTLNSRRPGPTRTIGVREPVSFGR